MYVTPPLHFPLCRPVSDWGCWCAQRRRKQFAFLAHALRDLQCSLQDEAALAPVAVAKHDQMDTTED